MPLSEAKYALLDTWKEILGQGAVWQSVLRELAANSVVQKIAVSASPRPSWLFVGCGTSYYLAEAAANSWSQLTGEPASALPASDLLLHRNLPRKDDSDLRAIVISRSGKTSEAVRAAESLRRELKMPTVGITCTQNSELEAACDSTVVLRSADENSVVMTRSFTSMLIGLQYLAALRAGNSLFIQSLQEVAEQFESRILLIAHQVESFVAKHSFDDYIFLGQGPFHGIAREAALKVMEMSCSYSQFFHTLEFRHGPKAIVSPRACLMFFLSQAGQQAETEVLREMKELGGVNLAVCNQSSPAITNSSVLVVELKLSAKDLALLAPSIVPAQLMGFFTGVRKGMNPDQPKNLTRVVVLD